MIIKPNRSLALALAAAAVWAAGCGTPAPQGHSSLPGSTNRTLLQVDNTATSMAATPSPAASPTTPKDPMAMWKDLALTADQQTKIKALVAPLKSTEDRAALRQQFITLIGADPMDKAALTTFITQRIQARDTRMKAKIQFIEAVRDVLTADQRQKAAVIILNKLAMGRKGMGANVQMKASDEAAVSAEAATPATPASPAATPDPKCKRHHGHHMRVWAAAAAYMLTGDKTALETALTPTKTVDERVTRCVGKVMGLTKAQRLALAQRIQTCAQARAQRKLQLDDVEDSPQLDETAMTEAYMNPEAMNEAASSATDTSDNAD